jgi:hypothetical protein
MKKFILVLVSVLFCLILLVSSTILPTTAASEKPVNDSSAVLSMPIIDWEYDQVDPSASFSPVVGHFMVVWADNHWGNGTEWDIYGRTVDRMGTAVSPYFAIGWENTNHRHHPVIAYNSVADEYLVVYEYEYSVTDHDLRARRVTSDGNLIGGEMSLTYFNEDDHHPDLCYNPITNQYLVVWQHWEGDQEFGNNDLYGLLLNANGTPVTESFEVSHGAVNESAPSITYISSQNQYLVVWTDNELPYPSLWKRWIYYEGTLGPIEMSGIGGADYNPALAADASKNEHVVVLEYLSYGPPEQISGYTEVNTDFGWWAWPFIDGYVGDELNPYIAYNPAQQNYTIAWEYEYSPSDHDIWMMNFDTFSPDLCCMRLGPYIVSAEGSWEGNPTVAASNSMTSLIAWEDGRNYANTGLDIYVSAVLNGMKFLPLIRK